MVPYQVRNSHRFFNSHKQNKYKKDNKTTSQNLRYKNQPIFNKVNNRFYNLYFIKGENMVNHHLNMQQIKINRKILL